MSIGALVRSMAAAGASPEVIALAVEAVEAAELRLDAQKAAARDRKRAQRGRERDSHVTVTGQSQPEPPPSLPPSPRPPTTHTPTPVDKTTRGRKAASNLKASRRCPADWSPSPADIDVAATEGFGPGEIERELAKIRDWEFRDARSDWSAVFRNWMRHAAERRTPNRPPGPANDRPQPSRQDDKLARYWAGSESAIAHGTFE